MATRANHAATAITKQGGKRGRRNQAVESYDSEAPLSSERNQRVFRQARKETVARRHNVSTGTEPLKHSDRGRGPGGGGPFERKPSAQAKRGHRISAAEGTPHPAVRKRGTASGRGISGDQVFITGTTVSKTGRKSAARSKPTRKGWDRARKDI